MKRKYQIFELDNGIPTPIEKIQTNFVGTFVGCTIFTLVKTEEIFEKREDAEKWILTKGDNSKAYTIIEKYAVYNAE